MKIDLTDSEWMSLIDGERDGLPACCANVSELRNRIIEAARYGGELFNRRGMHESLEEVFQSHDFCHSPALVKIRKQLVEEK